MRAFAAVPSLVLSLAIVPILSAQEPVRADTARLADIHVIGAPSALDRIPGSGQVIDSATLVNSRVFTVNEALRKVPGVVARDEEGFGLRPNIGIRGLNPTRSSKVLLLEDGLPFTIAPYGANESYYHPPVDRFERIEVLKGSGQILYGPQTVGGVINYVTPSIPTRTSGFLSLAPGNRDYLNAHGRFGGTWGGAGVLADFVRKQGHGGRDNVGSRLNDANVKASLALSPSQRLTFRGNYYAEDSRVTYSGLTESEFAAAPFQNPFVNDSMLLDRWGGSVAHQATVGGSATVTTTLFGYLVSRDWWRQSSNSAQRPNDAADPACASIANLSTTCGNEGRLRDYAVWGVEPRLALAHGLFGLRARTDAGVRFQHEDQDRRQVNSATPNGREPAPDVGSFRGTSELNNRQNRAYAAWAQTRLALGAVTLSPGMRVEHIELERRNYLPTAASPAGVAGSTTMTVVIPGFGATWQASERTTLFAGVHRGFAPPRPEDVVDNTSGAVIELDAEKSWNFEVGTRARPVDGLRLEATAFSMDFENQIVAASVAGGTGATLTSAGRTMHRGLELSARVDAAAFLNTTHNVWLQAAWTWLPTAEFRGERYAFIGGNANDRGKVYAAPASSGIRDTVSVTGNRLPYAPRNLFSATVGYDAPFGLNVQFEGVHIGRQFSDAANTDVLVADGQQGPIDGVTLFNASAGYHIRPLRNTVFVTVKNLFDTSYISDRTRGIYPGSPRLVQAGISQTL